ncbi:MAG: hypothetical protein V1837_00075 [Candidatus Woesearchaeota archaeon]
MDVKQALEEQLKTFVPLKYIHSKDPKVYDNQEYLPKAAEEARHILAFNHAVLLKSPIADVNVLVYDFLMENFKTAFSHIYHLPGISNDLKKAYQVNSAEQFIMTIVRMHDYVTNMLPPVNREKVRRNIEHFCKEEKERYVRNLDLFHISVVQGANFLSEREVFLRSMANAASLNDVVTGMETMIDFNNAGNVLFTLRHDPRYTNLLQVLSYTPIVREVMDGLDFLSHSRSGPRETSPSA